MSPVFTETFNGALVELIEIVRTIATYQAAIAAVEIEIVAMWIEGSIFLVSTAVQTPGVCVIAVEATAQNINWLFFGEQVVQLDHRTAASIAQIPVLVTVVQLFNGCVEDRLVILEELDDFLDNAVLCSHWFFPFSDLVSYAGIRPNVSLNQLLISSLLVPALNEIAVGLSCVPHQTVHSSRMRPVASLGVLA